MVPWKLKPIKTLQVPHKLWFCSQGKSRCVTLIWCVFYSSSTSAYFPSFGQFVLWFLTVKTKTKMVSSKLFMFFCDCRKKLTIHAFSSCKKHCICGTAVSVNNTETLCHLCWVYLCKEILKDAVLWQKRDPMKFHEMMLSYPVLLSSICIETLLAFSCFQCW